MIRAFFSRLSEEAILALLLICAVLVALVLGIWTGNRVLAGTVAFAVFFSRSIYFVYKLFTK